MQSPDKAVSLITEYTGVSKDVIAENLETRHLGRASGCAHHGQRGEARSRFRLSKTDTSAKVPDYVDMSYLSAATGRPVEQLTRLVK